MKYYHKIHNEYNYDLGYNINDLPLNKPIYGFAYDINDDTRNKRLNCMPTLGEISENNIKRKWSNYCFYPYKKGTKQRKKSDIVDFQSRHYADTYKEAVEMYNELVQKRIDNLKQMINKAENDKIYGE